MKKIAVRNLRLCTKDCLCLYVCPTGATDTEDSVIDTTKCIGCGACSDACPSGAISLVPVEYPRQQEKSHAVVAAMERAAENNAKEEKAAIDAAASADKPGLSRLMKAIARSSRLSAEDIMREAGYMLPQSGNALSLVQDLLDSPPGDGFPSDAASYILSAVDCNDGGYERRSSGRLRYRCSLCLTEFEVDEGEEPVCPMCGARGDDLELLG